MKCNWKLVICLALMICRSVLAGETGKIVGTVTDKYSKEPLAGVSVRIEGTDLGAKTDPNGQYCIMAPVGQFRTRFSSVGYVSTVIRDVQLLPDQTLTLNMELQEDVLICGTNIFDFSQMLKSISPTNSAQTIFASDIDRQPIRSLSDLIGRQPGVTRYLPEETASGQRELIFRGGRSAEVDWQMDGFSITDPAGGLNLLSVPLAAIRAANVNLGGFGVEDGRYASGIVNLIGHSADAAYNAGYHANIETATDNVVGSGFDDNAYRLTLSGPLIPFPSGDGQSQYRTRHNDKYRFFFTAERTWQGDRSPRSGVPTDLFKQVSADEVTLPYSTETIPGYGRRFADALEQLQDGRLPHNDRDHWAWYGKVNLDFSHRIKLELSTLGSTDQWQRYQHKYVFNAEHTPYYDDKASTWNAALNIKLSDKAHIALRGQHYQAERFRGDGVHRKDLLAYGRPQDFYLFDQTDLFYSWDDIDGETTPETREVYWNPEYWGEDAADWAPVSFISDGDEGYVYDDYLQWKSTFNALSLDGVFQIHPAHEIRAGLDYHRYTVRSYRSIFPAHNAVHFLDDPELAEEDTDAYGYRYNPRTNRLEEADDPAGNGWDGPREPKTTAFYFQDKMEYERVTLTAGIRADAFDANTYWFKNLYYPLRGSDDCDFDSEFGCDFDWSWQRLDQEDLKKVAMKTSISPRFSIDFQTGDNTYLSVTYGHYYQLPAFNIRYNGFKFLEHQFLRGRYFYPLNNADLKPAKTEFAELGLQHRLNLRSTVGLRIFSKNSSDALEYSTTNYSWYTFLKNGVSGQTQGVDITLSTISKSGLLATAVYGYSYGRSEALVNELTYVIAWHGGTSPNSLFPADFEQRHKLLLNLDWRNRNQDWRGSWRDFRRQAGVNALFTANSGTPYTPTYIFNETTLANTGPAHRGAPNSHSKPWTWQIDLKVDYRLPFQAFEGKLYLTILNLLDRKNAVDAYTGTGDPASTGFLQTEYGQYYANDPSIANPHDSSGLTGVQKYRLAEQDPNMYDIPRLIRAGLELRF